MKLKFSGILVEKWRRKSRGGFLAVANEAERLVLGSAGWRSNVEIMDFEGKVLRKFKTKGFQQIEITSDASKVYLLSVGGKVFAYNSEGKKLKKYKYGGGLLSISEDGSMVTGGAALMDAEGNLIRFPIGTHMVIDALSGKPVQKFFNPIIVGIAPNGTYVVAHEWTREDKWTAFDQLHTIDYKLNSIYMRPQGTNSLLESKEKQGSQQWRCVPFNLNTDMEPKSWYRAKVCAHNSFFACARKSIGYFGLDGNLKWEFKLRYGNKIKEFYVTTDAKYVFFTLKGRKKRKSIFILDAENQKVHATKLDIKKNIATFKATDDGRKLFVHTFSSWSMPPMGQVIAFDVKKENMLQA